MGKERNMRTEKKKERVISNCYLQAWCDPKTPENQGPYVWVHPAAGGVPKRKSPQSKWFTETDRFRIKSPNGDPTLEIKDTLQNLEHHFVRLGERLQTGHQYSARGHMLMCAFVAAMCSRNPPYTKKQLRVQSGKRGLAHKQAAKHGQTLQSNLRHDHGTVRSANAGFIEATLAILTPMLFRMCAGIFIVVDHDGRFISSDNPCVWHGPAVHRRPPEPRQPALTWSDIEITLPLGPKAALLFTHSPKHSGFLKADPKCVDLINQRTRLCAHEWFVTHDGQDKKIWCEERPHADVWENTAEDKKGLEEEPEFQKVAG